MSDNIFVINRMSIICGITYSIEPIYNSRNAQNSMVTNHTFHPKLKKWISVGYQKRGQSAFQTIKT